MWWVRRKWGHRCCWGGRHAEGLFGGFAGSRDWRRGGRPVGAWGGASVGDRGIDGDRLGWSVAADREFRGQITEGPQPLATGGADELAIGANHSAGRSHAGGDPRALGRARGSGGGEFDLAVLRPTRHQL